MDSIVTGRLIINEAELRDSHFFFELLNSPNWLEFIGDRGIDNEVDARSYIKSSLQKSYIENGFGLYKVSFREDLVPIGICGFLQRDYLDSPDIGFAILPKFEGMGLISEAASSVLNHGKTMLGFKEILGITTEENLSSRRVLTKIGLREVDKIKPDANGDELLLFSNLAT